jgi:hypothetical protein
MTLNMTPSIHKYLWEHFRPQTQYFQNPTENGRVKRKMRSLLFYKKEKNHAKKL